MDPNRVQPHPELLHYIQSQTSQGWTLDQVVTAAKNGGWSDDQIEACVAWTNNNYAHQQLSVNEVYGSSTPYQQAPRQRQKSRILPKFIALVLVSVVIAGGLLLFSILQGESDQDIFEDTIRNSLQTGTFEQKFTVISEEDQFNITARAESDFSVPQEPRVFIELVMKMNFDGSFGGSSDELEVSYEIIAINDQLWMRPTNVNLKLNEESRDAFAIFAREGESPDDAFLRLLDIDELNEWKSFSFNESSTSIDVFGFTGSLVLVAQSINTVLGEYIIADSGESVSEILKLILDSDMYTLNEEQTDRETINGTEYIVFDIKFNERTFVDVNKNIALILGLPDRHAAFVEDNASLNTAGDFRLWVDPTTKLPFKIDTPGDDTVIEYSNFGANFDIQAPSL